MHRIEVAGRELDLFYILLRELLWRLLRYVSKREPVCQKIPLTDCKYFQFIFKIKYFF